LQVFVSLGSSAGDLDGARDALRRAPTGAQVGQAWLEGAVALAAGDAAAALGKLEQARSMAAVEVRHARAARGLRALGIALRAAGLVNDDPELLKQSVAVLERSPARLELARSLTFVGITQRRARPPTWPPGARRPIAASLFCRPRPSRATSRARFASSGSPRAPSSARGSRELDVEHAMR
jgi:hypothetical protein